ncbi:hypothetical protein KEM55_005034, partial [Ascosphaera atra]
ACKFFEHFILISDAMTFRSGQEEKSLWNEDDGFYYDAISWGGPWSQELPVRSLVGLIPLYAVLVLEPQLVNQFPSFKRHVDWFIENKHGMAARNIASMRARGKGDRLMLSLVSRERLEKILKRMLDENEFFGDHGIRSMSKYHADHPYTWNVNGQEFKVNYVPGESDSGLFGGNSNWRGPIWLCVNFLIVESLLRFYMFYGNDFKIECPTGSGDEMHLGNVALELQHRLQRLMAKDHKGRRAMYNGNDTLNHDPYWKDYVWFYEYFDADTGRGLGASHQCGWTGLMAKIIHDTGMTTNLPQTPRTPSTAASHYFDDVFSRASASQTRKHLRRTSVGGRSIGRMNDDNHSTAESVPQTPLSPASVVGHNDAVSDYIYSQVEMHDRGEAPSTALYEDEFSAEASANGHKE